MSKTLDLHQCSGSMKGKVGVFTGYNHQYCTVAIGTQSSDCCIGARQTLTKKKTKRESKELFIKLMLMTGSSDEVDRLNPDLIRSANFAATLEEAERIGEIPRMKKFRFQLLHLWLIQNFNPCRVADIGGGKGFLAYLLQQSGWQATVIDPTYQELPEKYKDLNLDQRVIIPPDAKVPHITAKFEPHHARHFDLLVGMHAHACNAKIIDSAKKYGKNFVLLPCCIIDEPMIPAPGEHWLECLAAYAIKQGFSLRPFRLNFRGQNIGFYSVKTPSE